MKGLSYLLVVLTLVGCGQPLEDNKNKGSSHLDPADNNASGKALKDNQLLIKRSDYKGVYPFTVDEVILECDYHNELDYLYVKVGDKVYGLNGTAQELHALDDIWAPNPQYDGQKLSVSDVLSTAESLCKRGE